MGPGYPLVFLVTVADIKRLDLGNLNPIYERELNKYDDDYDKSDVCQMKGRWNVSLSKDGEGAKDVGVRNRRGSRCTSHCRRRGGCAR